MSSKISQAIPKIIFFETHQLSLQHKRGNANLQLAIRLWENININDVFDSKDEVFTSKKVA